ncbi:MAG: ABC transporter substrate-binding protein [Patescibacteria group bacterium]|nr:ABC transporter substrate-binding protein [Patescibacteria group bacterium]
MSLTKRLRFIYRFLTAVVKKQFLTVILGLFLGVCFFFFLPRLMKYLPLPKTLLKIGLVGQPTVSDLPELVLKDISYGLTKVSSKGEPLPGLATSWDATDQGKTYIFKINDQGATWHDGTSFSVKDINYNFKDISFSFNGNELTFVLKDAFSPLPVVLSRPLFKKGLIGLGDYKVKKIDKNNKFIKGIYLNSQKNEMPNKYYRFYNTESELKTAFNLGEVNILENLFDLKGLALGPKVEVKENLRKDAYLGLFLDTSRPPFSSKSYRQALAYAIPKETGEKRSFGPLNPDSWAYNPDVKPYAKDIAHAKQLLEKEGGIENTKIKIATFLAYEEMANLIKESWAEIGIDSEVQIISAIPDQFDVLLLAREVPEDPDQYYFWHSTQEGNLANFKSLRIDKLLEDGRTTLSREERKNIYFDFQRYLVEESPVIFLTHPVTYTVERK